MKIKIAAAALLVAAAVHADARIASPYPRKTLPPDGAWIVINDNTSSRSAAFEPDRRRATPKPSASKIF